MSFISELICCLKYVKIKTVIKITKNSYDGIP